MPNNNEKIKNLLLTKEKIAPIMPNYLSALKTRYEWTNTARSEYFKLKRTINGVSAEMARIAKKIERKEAEFNDLVLQIQRESAELLDNNPDLTNEGKRGLEELSELKQADFTEDYSETMITYIKKYVKVSKRELLYLLRKRHSASLKYSQSPILAKRSSRQLKLLVDDYMRGSFKQFSADECITNLRLITRKMSDNGFQAQAENLQNINIENWKEPSRPDSSELIEILHNVRQPDLYINRGYTVLDYVRPVYKSMNYFHRALRESREYVGTKNAYDRFMQKLDALDEYYREHYVQAGGKPANYHGHYAGEKP